MQNKFYELAFVNHTRNYDEIVDGYEKTFEPVISAVSKYLNEDIAGEVIEVLSDCFTEALYYAGVEGMEFAIGVMNGTIKQFIS